MVTPFFEFDAKGPSSVLQRLPGELVKEYTKAAAVAGNAFVGAVNRSFKERSSSGDDWLTRRTGKLGESLGKEVSGSDLDSLRLKVFSAGTKYAHLQEHGGTVSAKPGKFLTIPSFANKTAAGVPRFPSARDFIANHKGETFFLRTEAGGKEHLLLMWNKPGLAVRKSHGLGNSKADKGTAIPMFVLVRKVTVPPRFGFRKTWDKLAPDRTATFARANQRALAAALRGAG